MSAPTITKRSLAAHKANWTRQAGHKPAGQTLASATTAAIEIELITRAIERTGRGIAAMVTALGHMRAKQAARLRELARLGVGTNALKPSAKGGRS